MGLFSSRSESKVSQWDERFTVAEDGIGHSGDSSPLFTGAGNVASYNSVTTGKHARDNTIFSTTAHAGSIVATGDGRNQIGGITYQNFDPVILEKAYGALNQTVSLIQGFGANLLKSADNTSDAIIAAGEKAAATADGQKFDVSELLIYGGIIAGLIYIIQK